VEHVTLVAASGDVAYAEAVEGDFRGHANDASRVVTGGKHTSDGGAMKVRTRDAGGPRASEIVVALAKAILEVRMAALYAAVENRDGNPASATSGLMDEVCVDMVNTPRLVGDDPALSIR